MRSLTEDDWSLSDVFTAFPGVWSALWDNFVWLYWIGMGVWDMHMVQRARYPNESDPQISIYITVPSLQLPIIVTCLELASQRQAKLQFT